MNQCSLSCALLGASKLAALAQASNLGTLSTPEQLT